MCSSDRTVLLILPGKGEAYPLSTAALTCAQASLKQLRDGYANALVLDVDGALRRIESVEVLGPWGISFWRRVLSRLTSAWSIRVHLSEPLPYTLDQIKQLLIRCLASAGEAEAPHPKNAHAQSQFAASVNAATTMDELVTLLNLPAPADALDVL